MCCSFTSSRRCPGILRRRASLWISGRSRSGWRRFPEWSRSALSSLAAARQQHVGTDFVPDGQASNTKHEAEADLNLVGRGFLRTMGIPLLFGRDFNDQDTETSPRSPSSTTLWRRSSFQAAIPLARPSSSRKHILIVGSMRGRQVFRPARRGSADLLPSLTGRHWSSPTYRVG
jgi:hypothetical protein